MYCIWGVGASYAALGPPEAAARRWLTAVIWSWVATASAGFFCKEAFSSSCTMYHLRHLGYRVMGLPTAARAGKTFGEAPLQTMHYLYQ